MMTHIYHQLLQQIQQWSTTEKDEKTKVQDLNTSRIKGAFSV